MHGNMNMGMESSGDGDSFCEGMGRVMLPGFQFSFNPVQDMVQDNSCILWLFTGALVDTAGKYAAAVIGTFFLSMALEFMRFFRAQLVKNKIPALKVESPVVADGMNASLYMAQVTIAYWLMLLVMLYEAMMFIAIVAGLGAGYFAVLTMTRRLEAACADQEKGKDPSDMENTGGSCCKKDETLEALTPCCANA